MNSHEAQSEFKALLNSSVVIWLTIPRYTSAGVLASVDILPIRVTIAT